VPVRLGVSILDPGQERLAWPLRETRKTIDDDPAQAAIRRRVRLDYQVTTPGLADRARSVEIYKEARFSDHAPLIMDYDFEFPGRE
jgi:endonuclease/exonuclease/phosphatase family metal-dependent hydrolase